ncbi:Carboxyl-terminal protease [Orrella dioscoreae]|uniref:Carboxyl-terminal protease n=2 Tax=Orrella dioscoreae TaxID=1851544 RepID=A0A1C3JZL1_9BURK|nr:Carboxyl-terminal protease [Orrella dioscoreae]SOE50419.1 Carboxyl-terminal protease [Orrella dioscoreae]
MLASGSCAPLLSGKLGRSGGPQGWHHSSGVSGPHTSSMSRHRILALLAALTIPFAAWAGPREDIEETLTAAVVQIQSHYVDAVSTRQVTLAGLRSLAPLLQPAALQLAIRTQEKAKGVTPQVRVLTDTLMRVPDSEREAALKAALRGMLAGLDTHSRLVAPAEFKPPPASVGLELQMTQGRLTVVRALPGGPAEQAGLRGGDVIVAVDETLTDGMRLAEAVTLLRGEVGTPVILKVQRIGESTTLKMTLVRAPLPAPPSVSWEREGGIAVIRIAAFNQRTAADFSAALNAAADQVSVPLQGLVLDLRGNAGGLLNVAEQVGGLLLPSGTLIGSLRGRSAQNARRLVARGGEIVPGLRMSVLVDGRTGAGAELVAGALQDHGRALLIGERTAGAGTVQTVLPLPREEGGLLLTSARMVRATGAGVEEDGVVPDVVHAAGTRQLVVRDDLLAGFDKALAWRIQAAVAQAGAEADVVRVAAMAAMRRD